MDSTRAASVAAAFDLGDPVGTPTFVARGAMGELWRVDVADGRRWAVKRLFEWARVDPRPTDLELQLAARGAGIPLPRPHTSIDGRAVVDATRVYEWVDLAPPVATPVDGATAAEVGRILGTLHALALEPAPGQDVDDWYRFAPSIDELAALADRGDHAGRAWASGLRRHLPRLRELAALVASSPMRTDDVIVCHCDLTVDNVFRPAGGGPLVVLDWENAGPLSAESELAMIVACWCTPESEPALLDAYEAAGGPAAIKGPASFAANVATVLNYVKVLAEHSLDDDGHRAFAEPQLETRLRVGFDFAVPRGWTS